MSNVLPPPPKGRPPTMKQPEKLYLYLCQKAASEGKDDGMVVVPGVNGAAPDAALYYPGGLSTEQMAYFQKGGNSSVMAIPSVAKHVPKDQEPELTDEEILARVSGRFDTLNKVTHGVCNNIVRGLIVSGAGGVGKTFTVESIVDHYREKNNLHAEVRSGVITPISLFALLYRNRFPGAVTVLDDADGVFWNEDSITLLKAALDTSHVRRLSWLSNSKFLKDENVEKEFIYEGSMIFLTNLNFKQYTHTQTKIAPHLQALMTRSMYLDLKLHNPRDLTLWIHHMVKTNHILKQKDLDSKQEDEVLDFMFANQDNMNNLSIRTALKIADCINLDPDNWQQLAMDTVLDQ